MVKTDRRRTPGSGGAEQALSLQRYKFGSRRASPLQTMQLNTEVKPEQETTMVRSSQQSMPIPSLRSCCRCGTEFRSSARELVCPSCRKPKVSRHLSFREKQIVDLVRQAKANKEIAYELHLSERQSQGPRPAGPCGPRLACATEPLLDVAIDDLVSQR